MEHFCAKDKETLVKNGLDSNLIEGIHDITDACIEAYTTWFIGRQDGKTQISRLNSVRKEAISVRGKLAKLFRTTPFVIEAKKPLPWSGQNRSIAVIIQDLHDMVHLAGIINKSGKGFIDEKIINDATRLHIDLNERAIERALLKGKLSNHRSILNKAASALKKAVDTIHRAGKSAFIDDPQYSKCYAYSYHREYNEKRSRPK